MTLAHFCNNDEMRYVDGADKVREFYMKVLIHYKDILKFGKSYVQKTYNKTFFSKFKSKIT